MSLIDARINLVAAAGDRIPAAEPEDVERRIEASSGRTAAIGCLAAAAYR